jgi:hypothetical protein
LDLDIYKVCTYYFVFSVFGFFEWLCEEIVTIGSRDIRNYFVGLISFLKYVHNFIYLFESSNCS